MKRKLLKRLLPALMSIIMVFTLVPASTVQATDNSEFNDYIRDLAQLVLSTWSELFISEVEFRIDDPEMTVDGKTFLIDPVNRAAPYLSDEGRTMLPIGVLLDLLDLDVDFDNETFEITIEGPGVTIDLKIDSDTLTVNGVTRHLDSPPVIRNGRTYIPAGAVAECLLFNAEWVPEGRRVILTRPFQTGRLIIRTDGAPPAFDNLDGVLGMLRGPNNEIILQFDSERAAVEAAALLVLEQSVLDVTPDLIVSTTAVYKSWGVERIAADRYQQYLSTPARNLPTVTVAVLDTGIDASHPFLAGRIVSGWNFVNNNNNTRDVHGHGTHVAGTIAESTLSNVKIMPVKVLGDNGSGCMLGINAGIRYAVDNGANVINMSLGGPGVSPGTREAIQYAVSKNVVVVVSAGNQNRNAEGYSPANVPEAITVAACDNRNERASFSNFGSPVDISAPGVGITSSIPGGGYDTWNGTSMSAPHVAAAVALMRSDPRFASLSPAEIKARLMTFTDDAGTPGFTFYFGSGIVNLAKAGLTDTPTTPPQPPTTNPVTITWDYNGGSGTPASSSLTPGTNFGTLPAPNARTGFTFGGWFTTRDATGGTQITNTSTVPNSNTTYWARWVAASTAITLTQANPSVIVNVRQGTAGRVPITITAPSTGSVSIQSSGAASGADPSLYNASGARIADDEAGNNHFRYNIPAGQTMTVYAGTYGDDAASYSVTATFPSSSPGTVTLTLNNPSATITVGAGSGRVPITVTAPSTGGVTIQSSNITSGSDPTLFDASGNILADDEAGNWHWRYVIPAGRTMTVYAGTYNGNSAVYTVTATFPGNAPGAINLTQASPSTTVNVGAGTSGRVAITVTAPANRSVDIVSSRSALSILVDPTLYNASGSIIADDEAGNMNFRFTIPAGQTITVYAGTYGDTAASYTVTASF